MAIQTDQIVSDDTLKSLGSTSREQIKSILTRLNNELESPLRLHATFPTPDAKLNFSASSINLGDGAKRSIPALKSQVFNLSASSIDFQTQAVVGTFAITWPSSTVGMFRRAGFTLLSSGAIQVLFSAESATQGALANAGTLFVKSGIALGFIDLECTHASGKFKTAGSATDIIENSQINRFSSGSGGSSGSGSSAGGGELADLMFSAMLRDSFSDQLDGTTPTDVSVGKTDPALYDSSNELIRLNYDASKTVTGIGTAMTLNSAPSFTIKDGDVLIVNGEVRKFTVTNQTTIVLESAFSVDPTASACCVSQAVHTVDLNNFDNGGLGQSVASQYTTNIDEVMLGYADTETLGDIIPNFGSAPVVAFSASTDNSNWTTTRIRKTSLSEQESVVTCPTSNPNLYLRFFANKASGSGAVNLLSYKVAFHKILGQVAGANYYTAFARPTSSIAQNCTIGLVGGKTRFKFSFPYTRGLNSTEASGSVLEVIANGQIVPRYTAGVTDDNQAYFKEIDDSTIEMDTDYSSAGIDFQFKVQRVGIIDNNSQNTSKIALHDDLLDQTLEAQVIPLFRSAVNGAPSNTQFRSDITNRASMPDLSSMLSVQMGVQRMMTQEIYQIQNEFGPNGQPVFGAVNDKFNQIRYVGSGWNAQNTVNGINIFTSIINDYIEVVFYGTGLNILLVGLDGNRDFRVSVDGGSEGSNLITSSSSQATILQSRNYTPNQIVSVVSGLSLGLHTARIRTNSSIQSGVGGFEILTETTSLRVTPGNIMKGKYKNSLSALQTIAHDSSFESGALGSKGGCVLVYLKTDGTIGKAVTPTDTTALYLTSANHSNEEIVRTHNFREFGAGRSDDFSGQRASGSYAFTLDDGITTLITSGARTTTGITAFQALELFSASQFVTITFVGTGLDIVMACDTATFPSANIIVNGTSVGSITTIGGVANSKVAMKICSGLPYGSHTVKVSFTSGASIAGMTDFIVYAPKKPSLPIGAIELAQYYKVADFVANATSGIDYIATGVIRKTNVREAVYSGTWSISAVAPTNYAMGFATSTVTNGGYAEFTFFGTGFDYRFFTDPTYTSSATITINGLTANLTNFPAMISSLVGPATFNTSTGVLAQNVTNGSGRGLRISGLPLALYKIRITNNTTSGLDVANFDAISPIHAPTLNGPYVVQNTLSLGNNGFLDLRKFNKKDVLTNNRKICQSNGIQATTNASTSPVPFADMSTVYNSEGEEVEIIFHTSCAVNSAGGFWVATVYLNGVEITSKNRFTSQTGIANQEVAMTLTKTIYLPKGQHKIDTYWFTGGSTATNANGGTNGRTLTVKKLGV